MNEQLMALLLPLMIFTLTAASTPGPNNILLSANGAHFGFSASLPFVLGVRVGNMLLVLLIGLGLGALFSEHPEAQQLLKVLCIGYMLYLAVKIALSSPSGDINKKAQPLSFWHGVGFQFINPKTWMTAVTCISAFTLAGDAYFNSVLMVILAWTITGTVGNLLWVGCGVAVQRLLKTPRHWQVFNGTLALATLSCIFMILRN
jgi:threonine/homoserine/homoserine lactone efflux protein